MKILLSIFLGILAQEASIKELEDDIKSKFRKDFYRRSAIIIKSKANATRKRQVMFPTVFSEYGMLEMSDIEVTKVLESDASEWQKKLFNLYNPYPLKISFQNQLVQNYGRGARDAFDQLVKEGKGTVPKNVPRSDQLPPIGDPPILQRHLDECLLIDCIERVNDSKKCQCQMKKFLIQIWTGFIT